MNQQAVAIGFPGRWSDWMLRYMYDCTNSDVTSLGENLTLNLTSKNRVSLRKIGHIHPVVKHVPSETPCSSTSLNVIASMASKTWVSSHFPALPVAVALVEASIPSTFSLVINLSTRTGFSRAEALIAYGNWWEYHFGPSVYLGVSGSGVAICHWCGLMEFNKHIFFAPIAILDIVYMVLSFPDFLKMPWGFFNWDGMGTKLALTLWFPQIS
ncbi:hypothetical protein BT96DRAFT_938109 [Gymnopus androsaceus JB14]|uniref:Uncharacterized protein n=1 Tax=Gymnopus androsaceus JB14 TaxID=1447944 RepID=A0A6A4HTQ8_9AGAR|nr:hypothetical protein BT96DRAFT_938109 [Gymnopus androsaceus JB14]